MDIYETILAEHEAIRDMMDQIDLLPAPHHDNRMLLFGRLTELVITYQNAVSGSVYSALEAHENLQENALRLRGAHEEMLRVLSELANPETTPAEWNKKFGTFRTDYSQLLDREESNIADLTRQFIAEEQAVELAQKMQALKAAEYQDA